MLQPPLVVSLLLGGVLLAGSPKGKDYPDRPLARAKAIEAWFGGLPTATEMDHRRTLAEREFQRWERQLPGPRREQALSRSAIPGPGTWINLGPHAGSIQKYGSAPDPLVADTGRPTVILPHPTNPTRLYVGFAGGGVWRCDNADPASSEDWTWTPITDALPAGTASGNLSIGGLDAKPENPEVLYLALGDMEPGSADSTADGRGFYISTDGGDSWTLGGDLGATTRVRTVLALPGNVVLVAGNQGLYRSTDGGKTFTKVSLGSTAVAWTLTRLESGNLVLSAQAASGGAGSLWTSSDQGASWQAATMDASLQALTPRRISVASGPGNTVYALIQSGSVVARGVAKSVDGGANWTFVSAPALFGAEEGDGEQGSYNQMIAVDPTQANRLFVGTNLTLWRSQDGGLTWTNLTQWMGGGRVYVHADYHVSAWSRQGPKALYMGTDGGLAIVRDPERTTIPSAGGSTYVPSDPTFIDHRRNKGVATHLIYHLGSTNAQTPADARYRVSIGLQDMGTRLRTGANLASSSTFDLKIGGDGFGTLIHPHNGDLVLGSLYFSRIYRSANGGSSWSGATGIAEANNDSLAPFFTRLFPGDADPSGDTVYTFTNTKVYESKDFGRTWTALGTTGFPTSSLFLRAVGTAASDPLTLGALSNGGRVWMSKDGGKTWSQKTNPPNNGASLSWIAFDPTQADTVYVASVAQSSTFAHLWRSTDGGSTWTAIDGATTGFPTGIPVHCIKVDPVSPSTLYAGTDFGVYRSPNSGGTWERYGSGLPLVSVRDIYLAPDSSFMRIGTHGRGVWELPPPTTPTPPQVLVQPRPAQAVAGQSATFSVTATGSFPLAYQWRKNGQDIDGAQLPYYRFQPTMADHQATFTVRVTNGLGDALSQGATLTVSLPTGDVDGSGIIDVFDLGILVRAFGTSVGVAGFHGGCDLDGNGTINQADLDLLLAKL